MRRSILWLAAGAGVLCAGALGFAFGVGDDPPPGRATWAPAVITECPTWHSVYCEVCLSSLTARPGARRPSERVPIDATGSQTRESALFRDVLREFHPAHSWVSTAQAIPSDTAAKLEASPDLRAKLRALLDSGDLDAETTIRALPRKGLGQADDPELRLVREKLGLPLDRR